MSPGLRSFIREMPGKSRCDLSPLFADAIAFRMLIEQLAAPFVDDLISHVAGIDSLGFVLAGAVAVRLGAGFVPIRKDSKSAWTACSVAFRDYSGAQKSLELVEGLLGKDSRVLIVDDWSETGAQIAAAAALCQSAGATVVGASVLNADEAARVTVTSKGIERLHSVIEY